MLFRLLIIHKISIRDNALQNLAKSDLEFREASRREDARLIEEAFKDHSRSAIAKRAAARLKVSKRQIEYWLECENDMPSWVPKAVKAIMAGADAAGRHIEGRR